MRQRAGALRLIAARVRTGVADLELLLRQGEEGARRVASAPGDPITISGAAAVIHSWYNEFEKLLEVIARRIDGWTPSGDDWHSQLAAQMAVGAAGVRPPVFSAELVEPLRELRAFRHLFRHLYVLNLNAQRVAELLAVLAQWGPRVGSALGAFADALDALAQSLEA